MIFLGKKGGAQPEPSLSWLQRVKIAVSAAKGLEFLHEKFHPPIIHSNIKSSKILLFDNDVVKIGDIGIAITLKRIDEYYETVWLFPKYDYEAPEYVMDHTFRFMPMLINDMPAFLLLMCCFLL
jgi:pto-interacting protein 1